jgi:hypothetical protein
MAHYAFLDENNIVTEVITGKDETDSSENWEQHYGEIRSQVCKRTSYSGSYRKNYAGIGDYYDANRDAFIPPKPYKLWVLDEDTCRWMPPVPYPTDGRVYRWIDADRNWIPVYDY